MKRTSQKIAVTEILVAARTLLAAAALCLGGCSGNGPSVVEQGIDQQILHIGNGAEPSGLDPHTTTGIPEAQIQMALFEGLVTKHPQTLAPVPAVAQSWLVSEDGLTYTFKLRDDARWSNGDDLVAQDFVWSWKRALAPTLGNPYAYSLFIIANAERYYSGELVDFDQVGVKALDRKTLQVKLESPTPYFLTLLDHHGLYPLHKNSVMQAGTIDDRAAQWATAGKLVGNGPFVLRQWQPNEVLVVAKNAHYWDAPNVRLNQIHFHPVENSATEERMFRTGQLHKTDVLPLEKIAAYRSANAPELRLYPYLSTYFYRLNTTIEPLNDVRVRQALALSIDRQTLVNKVTKGGQLPAHHFTPPNINGYNATAHLEFHPQRARALLAEAGYAEGEGFPPLEILYNTLDDHQKIAMAVQQMWKRELNIDVTLRNQEWKVFLDSTRTLDYQISRASWRGDYLDPNTFLDLFVTGGGNNDTGWSNKQYDELIEKAGNSADQQARYGYFQSAEQILMQELPIIPIYIYTYKYLLHPSVSGWYDNVLDYHPYKYVALKRLDP